MRRTTFAAAALVCVVGTAAACGRSSQTPASPSNVTPGGIEAATDGAGLKVTAPAPQFPINGVKPEEPQIVLRIGNASAKFATGVPLSYRFEVQNAGGTQVYLSPLITGGNGTTSHEVTANLDADQTYRWRARAEYLGMTGPWSDLASFIAPATSGYIRGNELYDPLINGKTVGELRGDVSFVPGRGIRLNSQLGYVSYELGQTLTNGEFSILVSELATNTKGGKTKLFAMAQGYDDIVTNDRRMTVEKRGDPPGIVAWRMLTHGDQIDTEGAERMYVEFNPALDYFWKATWGGNAFNLLIREGGVNGPVIYDMGKGYEGRDYDPNPHVVYLGAPVGRSGEDGASVNGVIIRQVWVSGRPRPGFANR